jgi:hypothetical protein
MTDNDVYALHFVVEHHREGGVTGRVAINDLLSAHYDSTDDTYIVYNPDGSPSWTSTHKDRLSAILLYLQRRLAIIAPEESDD